MLLLDLPDEVLQRIALFLAFSISSNRPTVDDHIPRHGQLITSANVIPLDGKVGPDFRDVAHYIRHVSRRVPRKDGTVRIIGQRLMVASLLAQNRIFASLRRVCREFDGYFRTFSFRPVVELGPPSESAADVAGSPGLRGTAPRDVFRCNASIKCSIRFVRSLVSCDGSTRLQFVNPQLFAIGKPAILTLTAQTAGGVQLNASRAEVHFPAILESVGLPDVARYELKSPRKTAQPRAQTLVGLFNVFLDNLSLSIDVRVKLARSSSELAASSSAPLEPIRFRVSLSHDHASAVSCCSNLFLTAKQPLSPSEMASRAAKRQKRTDRERATRVCAKI